MKLKSVPHERTLQVLGKAGGVSHESRQENIFQPSDTLDRMPRVGQGLRIRCRIRCRFVDLNLESIARVHHIAAASLKERRRQLVLDPESIPQRLSHTKV